MKQKPPDYFHEHQIAKILGVKVWELDDVPIRYRRQAVLIHEAKKEALVEAIKKGVQQVIIVEL